MYYTSLTTLVEAASDAVSCTAHVTGRGPRTLHFCISPHDESAHWAGDLSLSWTRDRISVVLEHSGPVGYASFAATQDGLAELRAWLEAELAE